MQEKILRFLFSNKLMAFLFIAFPTAMGVGTFLETFYSTTAAKIWIYNARWFEVIMLLLMLNFIGNIFKYKLLRKEKWAVLSLHLSFILILLGAFTTRYFGFEGVMPIREGDESNKMISEKTFLTVLVDGEKNGLVQRLKLEDEVLFSEHTSNKLNWNQDFHGQDFSISLINYVENVSEGLVLDPSGDRYLKIVEANDGNRHEHFLKEGEVSNINNILFTLNNPIDGAINIRSELGQYYIESPYSGSFLRMSDQIKGQIIDNKEQELELRSLYSFPNFQFVIPDPPLRGNFGIVKSENESPKNQDALYLSINSMGETKEIALIGGKGFVNDPKEIKVGGLDFYLSYGSHSKTIPFSLKLNDFIAEKYPGTDKSYSSFMSKVRVKDDSKEFDYDIYMNNILDYKGYRFFQASFDPDEKGTVLSVNHDWWGTWVTYLGYILLYLAMLGIFFIGNTRFKQLSKALEKISKKKYALFFLLFASSFSFSQNNLDFNKSSIDFDSIIKAEAFDLEHSSKFGKLVIQDTGGRMKPANTFSSELLRKVSKKDKYLDLNSDQVLLSIMNKPAIWFNVPIIYLKRGNDSIRMIAGLNKKDKYAALISFFDSKGNYKLVEQLEEAYKASLPNQFQKDFIELDRRINLLYSAIEGKIMRVFPIPNDKNNKWVSYQEIKENDFKGKDSLYVKNILPLYFQSLRVAKDNNDYSQADNLLESLNGFQVKYGSNVIPSEDKINAEVLYNKYDIFKSLYSWYIIFGVIFFVILIIQIFTLKKTHI